MPLSDHEQRLLEQMERALAAEDPKLASALQGVDMRNRQRRRAVVGAGVFVIGMVMLFGGAIMTTTGRSAVPFVLVSVVGFVVMLVSAYYVATSLRRMPAAGEAANVVPIRGRGRGAGAGKGRGKVRGSGAGRQSRRSAGSSASFMARMEERWRRRRDSGGL